MYMYMYNLIVTLLHLFWESIMEIIADSLW